MSGKYKMVDEQPKAPAVDWRTTLTPEEQASVERAQAYAAFWTGVQTNDWRVLIDKLAKLLDEKEGKHG